MRWIVFTALDWKWGVIFVITETGWVWKQLSRNTVSNNHFLKPVWKTNCPEVHCGTLDSYFQSNDLLSVSPHTVWWN